MKSLISHLRCGLTHPYVSVRATPKLPIDFKRVYNEDSDFIRLKSMNLIEIQNLFKTTSDQFTKEQLIQRFYYLFKLSFSKYETIQNNANESQQIWFQHKVSEAMTRDDWNEDVYNTLHRLSVKESESVHHNFESHHIEHTMKWLQYIGLSSTQPWNTMLTAKIINDLIMDNSDIHCILDVGCGIGQFVTLLNQELLNNDYQYQHKLSIDGIDVSPYCIQKASELKEYRELNVLNVCIGSDIQQLLEIGKRYQVIVSCDVLQQSGFGGLPGIKCIEQLMDLVDNNGYFVIVNSIISTSFNCILFYHDVLDSVWKENSFETVTDLQFMNLGGLFHPINEFEKKAHQNSCIFVKIMRKQ